MGNRRSSEKFNFEKIRTSCSIGSDLTPDSPIGMERPFVKFFRIDSNPIMKISFNKTFCDPDNFISIFKFFIIIIFFKYNIHEDGGRKTATLSRYITSRSAIWLSRG